MRTEKLEYYRKAKIWNKDVENDLDNLDRLLRAYIGLNLRQVEIMTQEVTRLDPFELQEAIRNTFPERLI